MLHEWEKNKKIHHQDLENLGGSYETWFLSITNKKKHTYL